MRIARIAAVSALVAVLSGCGLAGCGSDAPTPTSTPSATTSAAPRPASPAIIAITNPVNGSTVSATTIHVVVSLQNAMVVQATSLHISPTEGHVHLYIDGNLQYMAYTLSQDFPVHPGVYTIKAEFVASDHVPFNPRVFSAPIVFTVK
jgi:hypothetical protein